MNKVAAWPMLLAMFWRRSNWEGRTGLAILTMLVIIVVLGPEFSPYKPGTIISVKAYALPGGDALLGTDYLGRDLLSRMLYGGRVTLSLALITSMLGCGLGVIVGFGSSLSGGNVDGVIAATIDFMLSLPPIIFALVVLAGLGPTIPVLIVVVSIVQMPRVARIARSLAADVAVQEFVEVARARGDTKLQIMVFEILPNTLPTLWIEFALRFTFSILLLSALSFLGLGIQPPTADWGAMVRENLTGLRLGALAAVMPAAAISLVTVGVNLLIDGISKGDQGYLAKELDS